MPAVKATDKQKALLAATLNDVRQQSAQIHELIDFIRDNAFLPAFAGAVATPAELLRLIRASEGEFITAAQHHVPIYLGRCLIEEFDGHWSVEDRPRMVHFGEPYVDGFGNIGYENVYLSLLRIDDEQDVQRFDRFRASCRRAFNLRARFTTAFSHLSGSTMLTSDLERQCVDLDVLPRGYEVEHVWRQRVTAYAKLLKIKLQRG